MAIVISYLAERRARGLPMTAWELELREIARDEVWQERLDGIMKWDEVYVPDDVYSTLTEDYDRTSRMANGPTHGEEKGMRKWMMGAAVGMAIIFLLGFLAGVSLGHSVLFSGTDTLPVPSMPRYLM